MKISASVRRWLLCPYSSYFETSRYRYHLHSNGAVFRIPKRYLGTVEAPYQWHFFCDFCDVKGGDLNG